MTIAAASGSVTSIPEITARVLLRGISWRGYTSLRDELDNSPAHLCYDDGLLEIEVPSQRHEKLKCLAASLVQTALDVATLDFRPLGSTTWQRETLLKAIEADECYYVQGYPSIRGKAEIDLAIDPAPDLAIEVEVASGAIDKLKIYAALHVSEVWRITQDGGVQFLQLAGDR